MCRMLALQWLPEGSRPTRLSVPRKRHPHTADTTRQNGIGLQAWKAALKRGIDGYYELILHRLAHLRV
jgi:hypothetical protein